MAEAAGISEEEFLMRMVQVRMSDSESVQSPITLEQVRFEINVGEDIDDKHVDRRPPAAASAAAPPTSSALQYSTSRVAVLETVATQTAKHVFSNVLRLVAVGGYIPAADFQIGLSQDMVKIKAAHPDVISWKTIPSDPT